MKDYIVNENGVCLNPDVILEYNENKKVELKILTMQVDKDRYVCGHHFQTYFGSWFGSSFPVTKNKDIFSKDDCIKTELGSILHRLKHELKQEEFGYYNEEGKRTISQTNIKQIKSVINWAESQLTHKQLTLFDL